MQLLELLLFVVLWGCLLLRVSPSKYKICNTPGCLKAAAMVRNNMDSSVDPCSNFYEFACGQYMKREKVARDQAEASSFVKVEDILQNQLLEIIQSSPPPNEPKPFKMARNLYNICMKLDLMDERGVDFVVDMTKKAGGWPVLEGDKWNSRNFDWVEMLYKLHDLGLGGELFNFFVDIDRVNSSKLVLSVNQIEFGLDRAYMIQGRENKLVQAYARYMVDIAHLFGADLEVAQKEMSDALDFEIEIAKIALSKEERRDIFKLYNPMNIQELQARYPIVLWEEYASKMMYNITALLPDEIIVVETPKYLDSLQDLVKRVDNRTLANYIMWRATKDTVDELTEAMRARQFELSRETNGIQERKPRWKECVATTSNSLPLAIGAWYVRNFYNEESKTNAEDMVERIQKEMLAVLKEVDWMDEGTRSNAIDKAQAITNHIAYPSELLEDEKIEKYYSRLEITGEKFFESMINVTKFQREYYIRKLRERFNKTSWETHGKVAIINAFYSPEENSIQFPAGILQDVFFSPDRPRYMNYGGIGLVIGHEITHGFDDKGSQFDKSGNLAAWWKPKTKEEFKTKMQCIIDQANNYRVKSVNLTLNGINTQGENCADIGGYKLSANAYTAWVMEHGEEPRLGGLEEYSPYQLFWLSAANVWCSVYREPALRWQITTDSHAPSEYRINGAFRNQHLFAWDFNCPLGSNMNPVDKCGVW